MTNQIRRRGQDGGRIEEGTLKKGGLNNNYQIEQRPPPPPAQGPAPQPSPAPSANSGGVPPTSSDPPR